MDVRHGASRRPGLHANAISWSTLLTVALAMFACASPVRESREVSKRRVWAAAIQKEHEFMVISDRNDASRPLVLAPRTLAIVWPTGKQDEDFEFAEAVEQLGASDETRRAFTIAVRDHEPIRADWLESAYALRTASSHELRGGWPELTFEASLDLAGVIAVSSVGMNREGDQALVAVHSQTSHAPSGGWFQWVMLVEKEQGRWVVRDFARAFVPFDAPDSW